MLSKISPGAGIAVVTPAGFCQPEAYRAGVDILASRYKIVHGREAPTSPLSRLPYLAAEDHERASQLNRALRDPAVEAVVFARGGYGCVRMVSQLDHQVLTRRRLPLVGFSDITAIHAWAAGHQIATVHGPVVSQLSRLPARHLRALFELLEGRRMPRCQGLEPLVPGRASGLLWGGNLSVIASLCGTPLMPDLTGRVLLLEEVSEAPYRLDRLLTQLRQAGVLRQVAGIVVGELLQPGTKPASPSRASTETTAATESEAAAHQVDYNPVVRTLLADRLGDLGVPVALGAPVGHGEQNLALPLGLQTRLDAGEGTLLVTSS